MSRLLAFVAAAVVLTAVVGAVAVVLRVSAVPVVPGVLLVAYVTIVHPPVEAAVVVAFIGLVMDALGGTPLGLNVLSSVAVLVATRPLVGWVPFPRGLPSFVFVAGVSAAHGFLSLLLLYLFQRRESFGLVGLVSTSLANACASLVVFPLLRFVLVGLKLEDKGETLQERLAAKS